MLFCSEGMKRFAADVVKAIDDVKDEREKQKAIVETIYDYSDDIESAFDFYCEQEESTAFEEGYERGQEDLRDEGVDRCPRCGRALQYEGARLMCAGCRREWKYVEA